jgi:hypothetical protein
MAHDGQAGFAGTPPKKSANVYTYPVNTTRALRLMSNRRKLVSVVGNNNYIASVDTLDLSGAQVLGGDLPASRQVVITPDEKFMFNDAGPHGTGSVQSIRLSDGFATIANIASPFDGSFSLRAGYRGIAKAMTQSPTRPKPWYCFWGLFWPLGAAGADFRKQGLVTYFSEDVQAITVIGSLPPNGPFQDRDVLMSYDANNLWLLCHDGLDDTHWICVVKNDFFQTVPQHLTTLKVAALSTTPVQFIFSDEHKKMAILMQDGTIQVWSILGDNTVVFSKTVAITNLRWVDTAMCFERLQPNSNFKGCFFVIRTTKSGNSRSIIRISWNDFSIAEEFDLSNYVYQDSSGFPVPPPSPDTLQINDVALDTKTGEFFCAFSNTGGGQERKQQLSSRAFRRMNYF